MPNRSQFIRPTTAALLACGLILGLALTLTVNASESLLPPNWDPVLAGDQVLARLVCITAPKVKGAHDAEMAIVEGPPTSWPKSTTWAGESAGWPKSTRHVHRRTWKRWRWKRSSRFARSEQAFENETLPVGACFVPRILQIEHQTLRCYFASEQPGKRQAQTWYRDFDIARAIRQHDSPGEAEDGGRHVRYAAAPLPRRRRGPRVH